MTYHNLKKFTTRAFSYLLDSPQQHPSLAVYSRVALPVKYKFERPEHLELDKEATAASADHEIRPVLLPKRTLIMHAGYAEVINAGKTLQTNEDQSCLHSFVVTVPIDMRDEIWTTEMCQIPCIYYGIFDGHAGTGAALFAYNNLHHHIKAELTDLSHMLVMSGEEIEKRYLATGLITSVNTEQLVIGAIEQAFVAMDKEIKRQRYDFRIEGGCTALVALIILGKLFVANAGDCRAVIYQDSTIPHQMSFDHTPESERCRIQQLAFYKPNLLMNSYTRYQFQHRCRKKDVGTKQMYRDYHMSGWGLKMIEKNDVKPQVICGEGKRARLLDTIGTTRGFGDHDLEVPYCPGLQIKPFLTAAPDVKVFELEGKVFQPDDVLVLGSDGLWEKLTNEKVLTILKDKFRKQPASETRRYVVAAQGLADEARGAFSDRGWRTLANETASYDDISLFVIPLNKWKSGITTVKQAHRLEYGIPPAVSDDTIKEEYLNIPDTRELDARKKQDDLNAITKTLEVKNVNIENLNKILEKKENVELVSNVIEEIQTEPME